MHDRRRVRKTRKEIEKQLDVLGQVNWTLESDDIPDFVTAEKFEWLTKNWFGIEDVASAVGCSMKTIQRWQKSGRLEGVSVLGMTMFSKEEIVGLGHD
jgi:hypothetical protein